MNFFIFTRVRIYWIFAGLEIDHLTSRNEKAEALNTKNNRVCLNSPWNFSYEPFQYSVTAS